TCTATRPYGCCEWKTPRSPAAGVFVLVENGRHPRATGKRECALEEDQSRSRTPSRVTRLGPARDLRTRHTAIDRGRLVLWEAVAPRSSMGIPEPNGAK